MLIEGGVTTVEREVVLIPLVLTLIEGGVLLIEGEVVLLR